MSLFGGNVGDYMTPDGRIVQMPAGLAAGYPDLRPVAPPPSIPNQGPQSAGPILAAPDAMTALPLGPAGNPAAPPVNATQAPHPAATDGPVTSPAQVPAGGPPSMPARGPVTSPDQDAGPPNTGNQKPMTEADIAKMGVAGPANASLAASDAKAAAVQRQGNALADQAMQVGTAMADAEDVAKQKLEAIQAEADRRQAQLDMHNDELLAQAKKIANTKIDRTADHPILSAIGIALATLGTAMQNRDAALAAAFRGQAAPAPIENPGLKAFYEGIDRKVAAQMQDLDQQRAAYEMQGKAVGNERLAMKDRLDQMASMRIGYLEQGKMQVERIKQQTQSPVIRANADVMLADVQREKADTLANAQGRWRTHQDAVDARNQAAKFHNDTIKLERDRMAQQDRQFSIGLAERAQERADTLAEKMLERGDKAGAEKAKQLGELGVVDPSTGDYMLSPAGMQKMAQADQLEAAARKATDPAQAKKLTDQADLVRQSAMVNDAALGKNKKGIEEAQKKMADAQDMINQTDLARRALQEGPSPTNREAWAELTTRLTFIKAQAAKGIGERVSVRAMEALDDVLSIDPDSWTSRAIDKGKAIKALDTLDTEFGQAATVALKSAGIQTPWRPGKAQTAAEFKGQTATEVGRDADAGFVKRNFFNPLGTDYDKRVSETTDSAGLRTNARGQASTYGLEPGDDDKVRELIKRSGSVGNAEYGRIVEQLAKPLANQAADRPSLVRGIGELVRDEDPKLFGDVMARVRATKGDVVADQLATMLKPAPALGSGGSLGTPVGASGLTTGARQQLEESKVRTKYGISRPETMPAMTPTVPDAPQNLPAFFGSLSPVDQQRYLAYMRSVSAGGAQ